MPWTLDTSDGTITFDGSFPLDICDDAKTASAAVRGTPLASGRYIIGPAFTHPQLGPYTMNIWVEGSDAAAAFICSDGEGAPDGSILLPESARQTVCFSRDEYLLVLNSSGG